MMKNEYMNQIAKLAAEKFNLAKNLILEEMQDAMNEVDKHKDDDKHCANVVQTFMDAIFGDDEDECDCCCDECEECCDEAVILLNPEAIEGGEDYREVSVMFKDFGVDSAGELKVAVEFDDDLDIHKLPTVFAAAISEVLYEDLGGELISKEEIEEIIGTALFGAILKLGMKGLFNAIGGDNE